MFVLDAKKKKSATQHWVLFIEWANLSIICTVVGSKDTLMCCRAAYCRGNIEKNRLSSSDGKRQGWVPPNQPYS